MIIHLFLQLVHVDLEVGSLRLYVRNDGPIGIQTWYKVLKNPKCLQVSLIHHAKEPILLHLLHWGLEEIGCLLGHYSVQFLHCDEAGVLRLLLNMRDQGVCNGLGSKHPVVPSYSVLLWSVTHQVRTALLLDVHVVPRVTHVHQTHLS